MDFSNSSNWTKERRENAGKRFAERIANARSVPAESINRRRMTVATDLGIAIAESHYSRKDVAERAEMKAALLSRQLSGNVNLTIDSIGRICDAIGYDFDVVLRVASEAPTVQPWARQLDRAKVYRLMQIAQHREAKERAPAVWRSGFLSKSDLHAANHEFEMGKEVAA